MNYQEEKERLNKIMANFLHENGDIIYTNEDAGNTCKLAYFDEEVTAKVDYAEADDSDVYVHTTAEEYPNGYEIDIFKEFSNDEMKKIMDIFGIEY